MHELTAYFITTDRMYAPESLASLEAQNLTHPIEIVRNVRPLREAHLPTLECETPYCVVLDDDVILERGVVRLLLDEFRSVRLDDPRGYKINARVYCEAKIRNESGGFHMFHAPSLKRIGWPEAPHVSVVQSREAKDLGFESLRSDLFVGVQKMGTALDVYKKYLWLQIRWNSGQSRGFKFRKLLRRARRTDDRHWWAACLGVIDGLAVGIVGTSKDEAFVGPIGARIDVDAASADELRSLVQAQRTRRGH